MRVECGGIVVGKVAYDRCVDDAETLDRDVGDAVAAALWPTEPDRAAELRDAWRNVPTGIRMDGFRLLQLRQFLPEPEQLSRSRRAWAHHQLVRRLHNDGVAPARYEGSEGRDLENTAGGHVLEALQAFIDAYDRDALIALAFEECQRAHWARYSAEREIAFKLRLPQPDIDEVEGTKKLLTEFNELYRSQAMVIEEALRRPLRGTTAPDRLDWSEILALAAEYLDSVSRSEGIHVGVEAVDLELTANYELRVVAAERDPLIDVPAFATARARWNPISARLPHLDEDDEPVPDATQSLSLLDVDPDLAPIDQALLAARGTGLEPVDNRYPLDPRHLVVAVERP
jgi:hypothetical protein